MTPKEGEALLRELGNMAPSKSTLDRLPKALSARWEADREAFESTLREVSMVPDEAVTVVMKDPQRAEKRERSRANEPACEGADAVSGGRLRDAARTGAKFTLRPSMGTALRYLSSRGDRPQQRGGVSSYASRVVDQYRVTPFRPSSRGGLLRAGRRPSGLRQIRPYRRDASRTLVDTHTLGIGPISAADTRR